MSTAESLHGLIANWRFSRRTLRTVESGEVVETFHELAHAIIFSLKNQLEKELDRPDFKIKLFKQKGLKNVYLFKIYDFSIMLRVSDILTYESEDDVEEEEDERFLAVCDEEAADCTMWRSRYIHIHVSHKDRSYFDGRVNCVTDEETDDLEISFTNIGEDATYMLVLLCNEVIKNS
ncbi:MAG: hypothetical protein WC761_05535 [Candidatus Paceibacterota bacterium]